MRSRCDFNSLCAIIAPLVPPSEEEGERLQVYPRPGIPALAGVATLLAAPDWLRATPGAGLGGAFPWTRQLRGIHESDVVRPREDGKREEATEEEAEAEEEEEKEEEVRIVLYPCDSLSILSFAPTRR